MKRPTTKVDTSATIGVYQPPLLANIVTKIRDARLNRGMSVAAAAKAAGVTRAYLWQIEAGDANPTVEVLKRIAAVVGLEIVAQPRKG